MLNDSLPGALSDVSWTTSTDTLTLTSSGTNDIPVGLEYYLGVPAWTDSSSVQVSYDTLLDSQAVSKTLTTYTLANGRSLSNYDTLMFQVKIGNYWRKGLTIPVSRFSGAYYKLSLKVYSGGELVELYIEYLSATQVKMAYYASGTFSVYASAQGLT